MSIWSILRYSFTCAVTKREEVLSIHQLVVKSCYPFCLISQLQNFKRILCFKVNLIVGSFQSKSWMYLTEVKPKWKTSSVKCCWVEGSPAIDKGKVSRLKVDCFGIIRTTNKLKHKSLYILCTKPFHRKMLSVPRALDWMVKHNECKHVKLPALQLQLKMMLAWHMLLTTDWLWAASPQQAISWDVRVKFPWQCRDFFLCSSSLSSNPSLLINIICSLEDQRSNISGCLNKISLLATNRLSQTGIK